MISSTMRQVVYKGVWTYNLRLFCGYLALCPYKASHVQRLWRLFPLALLLPKPPALCLCWQLRVWGYLTSRRFVSIFFCKDLIHKAVQFKSRHFAWPDAWCALLVVPTLSQSLLFERFRIHVQTCTWFPKDCTPCTASCTFPSAVHVNCASKSAHEYTRGSQKRLKSSVIWSQMTVCEPCKKYHVNRRCKTDLGAVCLMCLSPSLF